MKPVLIMECRIHRGFASKTRGQDSIMVVNLGHGQWILCRSVRQYSCFAVPRYEVSKRERINVANNILPGKGAWQRKECKVANTPSCSCTRDIQSSVFSRGAEYWLVTQEKPRYRLTRLAIAVNPHLFKSDQL